MPALAADIVAAAKSLYDQPTADAVTAAFHARGIL
jgi:Zn-dependent metalloprotease